MKSVSLCPSCKVSLHTYISPHILPVNTNYSRKTMQEPVALKYYLFYNIWEYIGTCSLPFFSKLMRQFKGNEKGRIIIQRLLDFLKYLTSIIFSVLSSLFSFRSSGSSLFGNCGPLCELAEARASM